MIKVSAMSLSNNKNNIEMRAVCLLRYTISTAKMLNYLNSKTKIYKDRSL